MSVNEDPVVPTTANETEQVEKEVLETSGVSKGDVREVKLGDESQDKGSGAAETLEKPDDALILSDTSSTISDDAKIAPLVTESSGKPSDSDAKTLQSEILIDNDNAKSNDAAESTKDARDNATAQDNTPAEPQKKDLQNPEERKDSVEPSIEEKNASDQVEFESQPKTKSNGNDSASSVKMPKLNPSGFGAFATSSTSPFAVTSTLGGFKNTSAVSPFGIPLSSSTNNAPDASELKDGASRKRSKPDDNEEDLHESGNSFPKGDEPSRKRKHSDKDDSNAGKDNFGKLLETENISSNDSSDDTNSIKVPHKLAKLITGEEEEETIFTIKAKLFALDVESGQWKERGVGPLRLNRTVRLTDTDKPKPPRLVMRADAVYRVIMNVTLFKGMIMDKDTESGKVGSSLSEKFVRLHAFENASPVQFAIKVGSAASAQELYKHIIENIPA